MSHIVIRRLLPVVQILFPPRCLGRCLNRIMVMTPVSMVSSLLVHLLLRIIYPSYIVSEVLCKIGVAACHTSGLCLICLHKQLKGVKRCVYSSSWEPISELPNMSYRITQYYLLQMQMNALCLNPSQAGWCSIYLLWRDGRLS